MDMRDRAAQEPTPEMGCMGVKDPAEVFGYASSHSAAPAAFRARPQSFASAASRPGVASICPDFTSHS